MKHIHPLLVLLLSATNLVAQNAPAFDTTAATVVVTGTRAARPADASPRRVTVIDSATVARADNLGQLLNEQAGIHVNGVFSNPGKDRSIFLRNGANAFTLLLIDGQPLLDPSSLGGAVDLRLLDLSGIERIEILRGGTSVLYGSEAVAGVVNLITRKNPAASSPTLHLRSAAQSYGTVEGSLTLSGATEKLGYTLTGGFFSTNGISEAAPPAGSSERFDRDPALRQHGSMALDYRPTEKLRIRPALRYARFTGDYDNGSFQDGDNAYTNEMWLPGLSADWQHDDWRFAGRYNFVATDRLFDGVFGEFPFRGRAHQGEAYALFDPGRGGTLTLGVQLRDERLASDADQDPDATTISPYVLYTLATPGGFLLDLGGRYNRHSDFGGQLNATLGLGVRTTDHWSTRLNLGTAFQSPTLDQLAGPFGANPGLQPQTSASVELATKLADPAGGYAVSLALFRREISNVIVFGPDFTYENRDELTDYGTELEGFFRPTPRWQLAGNLTYVRGRLSSPVGGSTVETEDFPRRPRLTGTLNVTYDPAGPFLARLTGLHTGERPDVFFDADFMRFDVTLDPYFLLHAYAEYRLLPRENLLLFGEVRNLTDTDFTEVAGFTTQGTTVRAGVALTLSRN